MTPVPPRSANRTTAWTFGPMEPVAKCCSAAMLAAGYVVVCSGGGGVPTVRREDGTLEGVEAVIDKDLTAALLAQVLEAQLLVIATDVDGVVTGWGTPEAQPVGEVDAATMRRIAAEQQFAAGSMGPKVQAVVRFAERGGTGVIAALDNLAAAVAGHAGTRVVPSHPSTS